MRWSLLALALSVPLAAGAGEIVHNYAPMCSETSAMGPGPGEEGHLAATRLTPPAYPFSVTAVRVKLHNGQVPEAHCVAGGAHRVSLWVSTSPTPEASPTLRATLTFPEEEVLGEERTLSAVLDSPLVLNEGELLYASVDFGGTHPDVGCVATCRSGPVAGTSFWSNANEAPYDWRPLESFGVEADLFIEAVGDGPAAAEEAAPEAEVDEDDGAEHGDGGREHRRRRRR